MVTVLEVVLDELDLVDELGRVEESRIWRVTRVHCRARGSAAAHL